jgi:hypothetical protein
MGEGWKEAINYIYQDVDIITETKIKKTNKKDAGDVDIAFQFKKESELTSILPQKCFFRPNIRQNNISAKNYLAEIKRSCPLVRERDNIRQFVNFYHTLLGPNREANLRLNKAPSQIQRAVDDANTVLLFVFNGADNQSVYGTMKRTIKNITGDENGKIMGRLVVTVWCPSADLIKWRDLIEKDAIIEEKDAIIEEKDAVIEEKDAIIEKVIEEKDAVIEEKDAVIEEKDAVIEELRRRLNEIERSPKRTKLS